MLTVCGLILLSGYPYSTPIWVNSCEIVKMQQNKNYCTVALDGAHAVSVQESCKDIIKIIKSSKEA